jgi:hypothetical protein
MRAVRSEGREWIPGPGGDGRGVQLCEWEKDEWTYHAKGDNGLPSFTCFFRPMLNGIFRHLVIAVARRFARPYNVRLDKPQLSLCALGHGVIVHYGHSFRASDRRTSASEERTVGGASRVFNATKTAASIRDKQDKRTRCRMEGCQAQSSAAHESDCTRCQRNALTLIIKPFI